MFSGQTRTDTAVVRTLRTGETANGPSVRATVLAEDSVLLLEAKLSRQGERER